MRVCARVPWLHTGVLKEKLEQEDTGSLPLLLSTLSYYRLSPRTRITRSTCGSFPRAKVTVLRIQTPLLVFVEHVL